MPSQFLKRARDPEAFLAGFRAIIIFLCSLGTAWAADPGSSPDLGATNATGRYSLEQVRQTALEQNWGLLIAKTGIDSATAQLIIAKEYPNPTFSISTARLGIRDSATVIGNSVWHRNYDTIAAVNQLIEIAGKRRDRQMAARAGVVGAKARFLDAKRSLDQGVTKAYVAGLFAEENVRVLHESAGYLQRQADIGKARFNAGDLSESDYEQILIATEQFELQAKAAEASAVQARIAVQILMGVEKPTGQWTPLDTLEKVGSTVPPFPQPVPGAVRPDVLAAETDLRGAHAQLALQRAYRIPDPTILLEVEHNPPGGGPATDTMGIGVSFPLPLWNRNRGNIKAAESTVNQLSLALQQVKAQAVADIGNADISYKEASERLRRYEEQISPQSAKSRASIAYAFEKGGATLVDLLQAERTDNDVRLATAQAKSDTASALADVVASRTVLTEIEANSRKF
jgi:cobalt-zinc-cadmium efflux system outer membrane protein